MVWLTRENSGMNGMTENRIVLDTNAVIFLTTRGSIVPADLQDELNEAELFISVITEIELFAKPAMLPDEEEKLRTFIMERIPVIDLTGDVKKETIVLRRTTALKLPDCIVAATAIVQNAILLTADKKLLSLSRPGYSVKSLNGK